MSAQSSIVYGKRKTEDFSFAHRRKEMTVPDFGKLRPATGEGAVRMHLAGAVWENEPTAVSLRSQKLGKE